MTAQTGMKTNMAGKKKYAPFRLLNLTEEDASTGCWIWQGVKNNMGYGQFKLNGKTELAHRVAWLFWRGVIPEGLYALHKCPDGHNPACCNPEHLALGTARENSWDIAHNRGSYHQQKLTDDDVMEIYTSLERPVDLADRFGVSDCSIHDIKRGRTWVRVTGHG
jgi:hypothetical protein